MLDWLSQRTDALMAHKWAPGFALLALLVGLFVWITVDARKADRAVWVEAYCAYGSQSEDQFYGCTDHVTIEDVERSSSDAAVCARDGECAGGGPYWQPWLDRRADDARSSEPPTDAVGPYGAVPAARSS